MDVPVVTMDRREAREHLGEYERLLRTRHIANANTDIARELKAARDGYRALAQGTPVISLMGAFEQAPRDLSGRPHLAIARSDRREVYVYTHGGQLWFSAHSSGQIWGTYSGSLDIHVPMKGHYHGFDGYAMVPMVPPLGIRAAGGTSVLKNHFTMWEVEEWADDSFTAKPDRDPLLLKPIGGDLYAVVHSWDLTEMERAIMGARI